MTVVNLIRRHEIKKWQWLMAAACSQIFLEEFFLAWSSNQGKMCPSWALRSKQKIRVLPCLLPLRNNLIPSWSLWRNQANLHWMAKRMASSESMKGHRNFAEILNLKLLWQYIQGDKHVMCISMLIFIILYKTAALSKNHHRFC